MPYLLLFCLDSILAISVDHHGLGKRGYFLTVSDMLVALRLRDIHYINDADIVSLGC